MKVISINVSEKKGCVKLPVDECLIDELGIVGDAHAGAWKRQISMLAIEKINEFSERAGKKFKYGEFAENITTEGIELHNLLVGAKIKIGNVILEVTQIGKKCHGDDCAIFREVGKCVMPGNGSPQYYKKNSKKQQMG